MGSNKCKLESVDCEYDKGRGTQLSLQMITLLTKAANAWEGCWRALTTKQHRDNAIVSEGENNRKRKLASPDVTRVSKKAKTTKIALGGEGKSEKITKEGSGKQIDNNDVYFNLLNNVRCTVTKWKNEIRVDIRKVRVLVFSLVIIF